MILDYNWRVLIFSYWLRLAYARRRKGFSGGQHVGAAGDGLKSGVKYRISDPSSSPATRTATSTPFLLTGIYIVTFKSYLHVATFTSFTVCITNDIQGFNPSNWHSRVDVVFSFFFPIEVTRLVFMRVKWCALSKVGFDQPQTFLTLIEYF